MSQPSTPDDPVNFETAMAELERIVANLEGGQLSLEQSLIAHKRGLELARYCRTTLAEAQERVRVLEDETLKALPSDDSDV